MEYRISVRNLVEFILRSGDLDNRQGSGPDREAMQKGSRLHRKIQKAQKSGYQSEVPLVYIQEYTEYSIKFEGRADGIITDPDGHIRIDEIKGMYRDVTKLTEPIPVHLAQAKCYAYMYGRDKQLETIGVRMTYANLETETIVCLEKEYTWSELECWFLDLVEKYHTWVEFSWQWRNTRNASMKGLEFPFPYRKGQREIVSSVYRTILRKKQLFIQAPTGVGKTMSVMFPALRACGEGEAEKVFYLTARTITRTVAEDAVEVLRGKGLRCKSVTLTAKDKLCVLDEVDCNPDICPRAKGHFDRVNDAVYELVTTCDAINRETILAQAEKWQVCPFEMMLDVSLWVDAIICDYNYVLDPRVRLKRFFADGVQSPSIVLIDEAHNLVDRGRDMYSAMLYKEEVLAVKKLVKDRRPKLARLLEKVNKIMLSYKRTCDTYEILENLGMLPIHLLQVTGEIEEYLDEEHDSAVRAEVLQLYFTMLTFENIYEMLDDNYVIYSQHDPDGRFRLKLFCVNPANNIQNCLDQVRSSVFFSATLLPVQYYRHLFSTRSDDYAIYAETSFLPEQKKLLIGRDISSKYTRRNHAEYVKIATYIHDLTVVKKGCYMVFMPSYKMLEDIADVYDEQYGEEHGVEVIRQIQTMRETQREEFLAQFQEKRTDTLIGFCVMGGVFSEGIDLVGERLIGALIVGTGLPQVSNERKILMDFYDKKGENGFDYAYRIPGMNKVQQSAGRVIRTVEDRGIIALLDERFLYRESLNLFPREWFPYEVVTKDTAGERAEAFWMEDFSGNRQ